MDTAHPLPNLIDRYHHYQQAVGRAEGTIKRYGFTFTLFQRFLAESGIEATGAALTSQTMERFSRWLWKTPTNPQHGSTQRSASGIHAHLRDMRAFTRWLYEEELLGREVRITMAKLPKRLFRILTEEEMARVWQSTYLTGTSSRAIRNRALIAFMLDTGLRREEVASVTLSSLNLTARTVTVIGKGNKERRVFFSTTVRELLNEFLAIRGLDDEPLFHLNADGIRTTFRRIQLDVGLEKFSPHVLRHQFATQMLRSTKNLEYVRLLLGHEDYTTTKRYLALTDEDLQEAHEEASPFTSLLGSMDAPSRPKRRVRYSSKSMR